MLIFAWKILRGASRASTSSWTGRSRAEERPAVASSRAANSGAVKRFRSIKAGSFRSGFLGSSPRAYVTAAVGPTALPGQRVGLGTLPALPRSEVFIMLLALGVILLIAWMLGLFAFHVAGGLIHLLVVLAVIAFIVHLFRRPR